MTTQALTINKKLSPEPSPPSLVVLSENLHDMNRILLIVSTLLLIHTTGSAQNSISKELSVKGKVSPYGIAGQQAPELNVAEWVDAEGKKRTPVQLADHAGQFTVIYGFQAWCPGCHSRGLPALKKMSDALSDNPKVNFMAIQTVFEGAHANTYDRMLEIQKEYDLKIPFGHDEGQVHRGRKIANTMVSYSTGGTPWFIFIDQKGKVVFNDFHLDVDKAIAFLKKVE